MLLVKEVPNANALWCLGFSAGALSGSMQFAAVEMLKNATAYSLVMTAILAVLINIRYAIYGLSFLRLFRCYPWYLRIFLIHALSDENFAIEASSKDTASPSLYSSRWSRSLTTCRGLQEPYWAHSSEE